ncbi:MAG: thioredoxin-disulfide reductase [Dethiobacteria bacterium]|jgi:thioredoxin reductase (NADPH)
MSGIIEKTTVERGGQRLADAKNSTVDTKKIYDLLILGAGPAGLTAAIYGCRANLNVLVFEQMLSGGEIASTDRLDNYPGFPEGVGGAEFGQLLEKQARRFGAEIRSAVIEEVTPAGDLKKVLTSQGLFYGRAVIVATGTVPGVLGVPGEEKLRGKGISFCATCDGFFFRGKKVAVIGGGDAALQEALFLTRFAEEIMLIHRRDEFRAVPYLQEQVFKQPRIKILWDTVVRGFNGEQQLEAITVANVKDGQTAVLPVDGAFLYIGRKPNTALLKGVETDGQGYIITSAEMETSLPGIFAAGDVRHKFLRQVVTAAADGAIAATMAVRYLG